MRLLKILLLLSFFFCFIAAGHGGGPFGMLEIGLLMSLNTNGMMENAFLITIIITQALGIYSLWNNPDEPDLATLLSTLISLIVAIGAVVISKDAIFLVSCFNSVFIITTIIYFIKSIQYNKEETI
jgi:hypothetical protein